MAKPQNHNGGSMGMGMGIRTDLPYLTVPLCGFQSFDKGEEIEADMPSGWDLQPDDRLFWDCAQFGGLLKVISCNEKDGKCVVKKIT